MTVPWWYFEFGSLCLLILVSVSVLFSTSVCLDDIYLDKVAEWPPFGRELLIPFTICSLCILT